jgi:hypothetical protein
VTRAVFLCCALVATTADAAEWQLLREKDGVRLEVRPVAGRQFEQVRVAAPVPWSPKLLCDVLWTQPTQKTIRFEQIVRETENERVVYEQVRTPVVSDRDYTMRFVRSYDQETNVCEIAFHSRNDLGPPPKDGFVRIPLIEGAWIVEPEGDHTLLAYVVYSEPGGWIAAWMAKSGLRDAAYDWVSATVARLREQLPR